jgi:hypothetical protein
VRRCSAEMASGEALQNSADSANNELRNSADSLRKSADRRRSAEMAKELHNPSSLLHSEQHARSIKEVTEGAGGDATLPHSSPASAPPHAGVVWARLQALLAWISPVIRTHAHAHTHTCTHTHTHTHFF